MNSSLLLSAASRIARNITSHFRTVSNPLLQQAIIDPPEVLELADNNYQNRLSETVEKKRARLQYQSRKRGMLENDLILSTFAHKYLLKMTAEQLDEYDKLINLPSNDWDLYNWAVGSKPTPEEFNNSVMDLLKEHTRNAAKEKRIRMPDLYK